MKQFKRMILASTLMVGLAGFAVSCKYGDDIDEIRKDIESLRTGQIASVESQLSSLQATVSNLSSASDAIKGSVSSLESKVNSLQSTSAAEIDALKSAIQNLQGKLSSLESSAATKTEVEDLQKKLEALSSALDGVKDDLSKFEGKTDEKFDEIDNELVTINSEIKKINGQLASILDQLETFAKAEDLQNLVDEVKKVNADLQANIQALQEAVAEIEKLKKADELLQTQIDELKKSLENYVTNDQLNATLETYATVKQVAEDIKAVTDALGQFTTEEAIQKAINDAIEAAVNAAGEPFKTAFQTAFDAAVAAAGLVDAEKLKAEIAAFDDKIAAAIAQALENDGVINEEIATQIGAAVADLQKLISGRLTSVVLIPELYVGGIEAIGLTSFEYTEKVVTSTDKKEEYKTVTDTKGFDILYSAGGYPTDVRYHVSPAHLTKADIEAPTFVYESAAMETRAAVKENLLNVCDWDVKDGELIMTVNKVSGAKINTNPDGTINTAAVRVPIAAKNLVDGEANAVVYSDYARLYERTYVPKIAALIDHSYLGKENDGVFECAVYDEKTGTLVKDYHYHFFPTYAQLQGKDNSDYYTSYEVIYNESFDLMNMVTGCYDVTDPVSGRKVGKEITKDQLADYGFVFRFAIPTLPNVVGENGTDQQVFAKLDGSVISSKLPNGVTNNKAAIGKNPIVRVELVDTNDGVNRIVDVRYFKIQWVEKELTSVTFDKTFDYTLRCGGFTGEITWDEVVNDILANIGEEGISYTDFRNYFNYYNGVELETEDHNLADYAVNGTIYVDYDEDGDRYEQSDEYEFNLNTDSWSETRKSAAFTWNLTDEQIGNVMEINGKQLVTAKHLKVTIRANSGGSKIVLNLTVNIKLPTLATMNGYNSTFWEDNAIGSLARVFPVQYGTPGAGATAVYNHDFHRLFADYQVLKGMLPCGTWDIQFAQNQTAVGSYLYQVKEKDGSFTLKEDSYFYGGAMKDPWMLPDTNEGYVLKASTVGTPGVPSIFPGMDAKSGTAAQFKFDTDMMGNRWYAAEEDPKDAKGNPQAAANHKSIVSNIKLNVEESERGISILSPIEEKDGKVVFKDGKDKKFTVKVWAALNEYNPYLVSSFEVRFAAPLYLKPLAIGNFTDQVLNGDVVSYEDKLEVYDFAKYLVVGKAGTTENKKYTKELYGYYGVEAIKLSGNNTAIMTNLKKDANGTYVAVKGMKAEDATVSVADYFGEGAITVDEDTKKITFKNVAGNKVESEVELYFPVSVEHKWGLLTDWVTIKVQANTINK